METKQVIVVRQDLIKGDDSVGKMMSQVAHASLTSLMKLFTIEKITTLSGGILEPGQEYNRVYTQFGMNTILSNWLLGKSTKIVVSVPGEKELLNLYDKLCKDEDVYLMPFALITDSGFNTCLGIGPYVSEEIDKFTKDLPLL